jgi:hypothetical protein
MTLQAYISPMKKGIQVKVANNKTNSTESTETLL